MVRNRWSTVLGLCLIAPLVWTSATASADRGIDAGPNGDEVRITRPVITADGRVDTVRTQALRTETLVRTDSASDLELLTSGANLVSQPELGPTVGSRLAAGLQSRGYTGRVRIGIIDFFSSALLASEFTVGELKTIPASHRKCLRAGKPCSFSTSTNVRHGNAMAEIISDEAPGAELFIAQADTIADYRAVIDWFALNNVKIVNHSLIGNFDGPGNGTGPQAAVVDYAVSKGMAWFNAAGDMGADATYAKYAGGYWRGTWSDADNDGWLNFKGTDETLGAYCGALLGLRWSDWAAGRTDYELWVNDLIISTGLNGTPVLLGNRNQAGVPAATPIEGNDFRWLCNTNSSLGPVYDKNKDGFVALKVKRSTRSTAASSKGDKLEIQVNNGYLEYAVDGGSVGVGFADTKNPGAATVGHLSVEASHGPTNDGRIKPDFVTDGCSPTNPKFAYGPCTLGNQYLSGDSAAAKTSGVAAAVLDALGPMKPAQLVQYLRNETSFDGAQTPTIGRPTPNNIDGSGSLRLRISGPRTTPYDHTGFAGMDIHVVDTRVTNAIRSGTAPVARNGAITFNPQRTWTSPVNQTRVVVLQVTTSGTLGPGTVQIGPAGWMVPGTSTTMSVAAAGQTISTMAFVPIGPTDEVTIHTTAGGHFHVDMIGLFSDEYLNFGHRFLSVDPYRAYNTRTSNQPLVAGVARTISIVGAPGSDPTATVPLGASAVVVSLTADTPAASGWVAATSAESTGTPHQTTLPVVGGRASTVTSIVPVDVSGRIRLWSKVNTHLQIDVLGYFRGGLEGGFFHAMPSTRVVDTRRSGAVAPAAGSLTDAAASSYGIPSNAGSVVGHLFSTASTGTGHLRLGRNPAAATTEHRELSVTSVNQSIGVGTLVALESGHAVVYATNATHRIFDATGWFEAVRVAPPGSVSTVPVDPAQPGAGRGNYVMSPDARTVAFATFYLGAPGITVWHRDTDTFEHLDLTTDVGAPSTSVIPEAVSNGGTRVVFRSTADNITPDGSDGGLMDWFVAGGGGLLRRLNETADGTRVGSRIAVDGAASSVLLQPDPSGAPDQLLAVDVVAGTVSPTGARPTSGYNRELTASLVGTTFWTSRNGGSIVALGPWASGHGRADVSPDGRYLYLEKVASGPNSSSLITAWLYDSETATNVELCTRSWFGGSIASGGVDWSAGPPIQGNWCSTPSRSFDIVSAEGSDPGPWTVDGRAPTTSLNQQAFTETLWTGVGSILFSSTAVNFVLGVNGGVFIYDRP